MYESFFGLREAPFNVTPDPRFIYFSKKHLEAFSCLLYGVERRKGFIQLTGDIGAGKTTLCRTFLDQMRGKIKTALILNPNLSEVQLLEAIVDDFGITPSSKNKKSLFDSLNKFLLEELRTGSNCVLIIDEAQNLKPRSLEQIRLLSNLETDKEKLLQIVLVGQPELRQTLEDSSLVQLKQRISIRYHLTALDREDTAKYILHRLQVAGSDGEVIFPPESIDAIYSFSQGIPRLINVICDKTLLAAYVRETKTIEVEMAEEARAEIQGVLV